MKTQIAGHTPRDSDSVGLGWGHRTCISAKVPGGARAPDPGAALRTIALDLEMTSIVSTSSTSLFDDVFHLSGT